jgi:release factor glutamine methyltransferase
VASRIHFLQCNLLDALLPGMGAANGKPLDLIVSNPPYIARNNAEQLQREVRDHEPHAALFGGPTGVEIYEGLIEQARELLRDRGILALELGHDSAEHVRGIFDAQAAWTKIAITMDLAGIPRVLAAERDR